MEMMNDDMNSTNPENNIKKVIKKLTGENRKILFHKKLSYGETVVLYESRIQENNIICLDKDYNIIWQVQRPDLEILDPFTSMDNKLVAIDWATRHYQINPYTGETVLLNQYEFTSEEENRKTLYKAQLTIEKWRNQVYYRNDL